MASFYQKLSFVFIFVSDIVYTKYKMPYCNCCHIFRSESTMRILSRPAAELIKRFTPYHYIVFCDNICLVCLVNEIQPELQQRRRKVVYDTKWIYIQDDLISTSNNTDHSNYANSSHNNSEIKLYLRYVKADNEPLEQKTAEFSLDTTLETVIRHLINELKLSVSYRDIILTQIRTTHKTICNIPYTFSTTLRQLNVSPNTYLYFDCRAHGNVEDNSQTTKTSTNRPLLSITVLYLKADKYYNCTLPYDATVQRLFLDVIKRFDLCNIDPCHLHLKTTNYELDMKNFADQRLVDLNIGTEYRLVDLIIEPEKSIMKQEPPELYTKPYIIVNCSFLQQALCIDLSTILTLIELKEKIIDQYVKERRDSLQTHDIILSFNGKNFCESDDSRLLSDLGINEKVELKADLRTKFNAPLSRSPSKTNEYQLSTRSKPVGLRNLGNTCFMNSVLQCLSHVTPLTLYFLNNWTDATDTNDNNLNQNGTYAEITNAYAEFIWNMWKGDSSTFSPSRIRNIVGDMNPQFSTYRQQDAQEFMSFLISAIHNDMKNNRENDDTIIKRLFYGVIQSTTICLKCKENPKTTSNVISFLPLPLVQKKRSFEIQFISYSGYNNIVSIEVPSNGTVENLVQIFIELKRLRHQRLYVLSQTDPTEQYPMEKLLSEISEHKMTIRDGGYDPQAPFYTPMIKFEHDLTLDKCIQEFLTIELIDKRWFCSDQCKQVTNATRQIQICSLPRVLIVEFKRFTDENGYMRKLDTYVEFPRNGLDLSKFHSNTASSSTNMVYDLIAVSNHIGSVYGGHYTAYARQNVREPWYLFDDNTVTPVTNDRNIVSQNAYVLVYLRREKDENTFEN